MNEDKLLALLSRAKAAADRAAQKALKERLKRKWRNHAAQAAKQATSVANDYAHRLAERRRFRALLSDDALDGERFRWYFSRIENSQSLDELRRWIDGKISREMEKENAKAG